MAAGKLPSAGSPPPGPPTARVNIGSHQVAGIVERPPHVAGSAVDLYRLRRHTEVRFRTVNVVPPELETVLVPSAFASCATRRRPIRRSISLPMFSRWMPRGPWFPEANSRCRTTRKCPLRRQGRILVHRPERGPGTGGQAVQLYPGFPGVANEAPPVASQFAAEVVAVFLGGKEDEIGVAVEEDVSPIVAVLPRDRRQDVVLPALHCPLRRIRT